MSTIYNAISNCIRRPNGQPVQKLTDLKGLSNWVGFFLFFFLFHSIAFSQTYCTPTLTGTYTACATSKLGTQTMGIKRVQIAEQIVFSTGTCADVFYTNYSTTNAGTVTQGHSYVFELERHSTDNYACHMSIFVDYNNDGIFGNAASGELIWQTGAMTASTSSDPNSIKTSAPILIPYQNTGALRMRVVSQYNNPATNACSAEQGQVYDFTLNVLAGENCVGAPAVANVTPASSQKCQGTTNVLSLSGLTPAAGYSYQWKVASSAAGPFINASGTSTNSTYTTPASLPFPTSYYLCEVTCDGGDMTVSQTGQVSTTHFLECYCSAAFTSGTQTNRGLTAVNLNGTPALNNTGTTANGTYTNYSSLTPAGITVGESYTLSTTSGSQNTANHRAAWIDFNQNGVYETSEFIGVVSTSGTHGNATLNLNFTVPNTALVGVTGMRVRCRYSSTLANSNACSSLNSSGETEDYRVEIIAACSAPTIGATASNVVTTTTSANLSWVNGDGDGGRLVLVRSAAAVNTTPQSGITYTANAAFGSGQQLGSGNYVVYNGSGNSVNITGLLPSTQYYYSIFEYNEEATCYMYTGHTGNFTTASCSPVLQASNFHFPCPEHNEMTFNFSRGNGSHVLVLARAGSAVDGTPAYGVSYNASTVFGSGDQIGAGNYVVYNGSQAGMVSMVLTGLNANTTYHFKVFEYNAEPNCYSTAPVSTSQATRSAGTYASSTVTQVSGNVTPWSINQQIVRLEVVVNGGTDVATVVNSITFNTTGTTNVADINAAKIYYTGTSNTFAATTQFGSTVVNPNGSHTVTGSMVLAPAGTHYFWVAYNLIEEATLGNSLDAQVTAINITDFSGTSSKTPSSVNPTGSRTIAMGTLANAACTPSLSNPYGDAVNGWSINGTSYPGSNGSGYHNQTGVTPATVVPGESYNLTGSFYGEWSGLWIWIDWSGNGAFTASEKILNEQWGSSLNIPITVPVGQATGPIRVRFITGEGANDNACSASGLSRSCVDYTLIVAGGEVTEPVICQTPVPDVTPLLTYTVGDVASPLTAAGTGLLWYTEPTGGTGSATAPTPSTAAVGTTVYYVSSTDGCESPRSQIAVYVEPAPCGPVIDVQPAATTAGCYSGYTQVIVQATGADGYQWQVSTNGGTTWGNLSNNNKYSGVTTNVLTITNPTANYSGYMYRVIAQGSVPAISEASILSVQNCPANDNPSNTNPSLSHPNYVYPSCTQILGSTEGATINSITGTRDVWYRFTAISNGVSIRVNSSIIDPILYVFEDGNMSTPIVVENAVSGPGLEVLNYGQLVEGTLYRLAVASASAVDGDFTICIQQLRKPQCSVNTNISLCEMLSTSITGANTVTYEFTDVNTNVTTSYTGPGYNMLASTAAAALRYGATYNAQYTATYNLQNVLGETETIVVPNTQTCNITIGAHREVVVKVNNRCTSGAVHSRTGYLTGEYTGSGGICTITGFDFEFTPVANCAGDDPQPLDKFSKAILSTNIYISLNYAFNHMPLASNPQLGYWSVRIRPRFNGYSGVYGQPYVIAVNGTAPAASRALNDAPVANAVTSSSKAMDANIYPNPNNGELVNLNITGITSNEVYVRVMDSMGREVYTNRYSVDGSLNTMVNFGQSLAQGVYMVEMRAGEEVKTQRMMVTK